ncbi:hypothetical protein VKT23_014055 [Stygiomarasmius scandens]|uniref:Uncharacterized protein n=1 Tax=Marasmiellus scandens TaxID=2682957 RepID=A0ABR1J3R3_9AGAR
MPRCVCIGPPNVKMGRGTIRVGLSEVLQWRPGGVPGTHPPFPMNIQCDTDDEAQRIWTSMQPWILQKYNLNPSAFIAQIRRNTQMQELGQLFDRVPDRKYWVVRLGSTVGVYFNSCDAVQNMDASGQIHFRRAFIFSTFISAICGMVDPDPSTLEDFLDEYYPSKLPEKSLTLRSEALAYVPNLSFDAEPSSPPAVESDFQPPVTLSQSSGNQINVSVEIHGSPRPSTPPQGSRGAPARSSSRQGTPARTTAHLTSPSRQRTPGRFTPGRQGTPSRTNGRVLGFWVRRYLQAHGFDASDIQEVEEILEHTDGLESFTASMGDSLSMTESVAEFLWLLNQGL